MPKSKNFTPWDFLQLAKELAEHEVEMKIRLANAAQEGSQKPATSSSAG